MSVVVGSFVTPNILCFAGAATSWRPRWPTKLAALDIPEIPDIPDIPDIPLRKPYCCNYCQLCTININKLLILFWASTSLLYYIYMYIIYTHHKLKRSS